MGMAMKELNFAQAILELQLKGAIYPGKMFKDNINNHPDWFEGNFTETPGMTQPHFQITIGSRKWYLRPCKNRLDHLHFGNDP
jgi:hypothetical protein